MIYTVIGDPHAKPDNLDKINTLFDMVEDLGHPTIWLGDLLDTKELVRGKCLNTYLKRFSESKLQHYVLVGNHDWFNLECKEHSLEALKVLKNVKVIDDLQYVEPFWLAPYNKDVAQLKEWVKLAGGQTLFCHADIQSFDYGNGHISTEGLSPSDFKKVQVISGHYHAYQKKGNITYLGTPFSHSFGESNQTKYIGVWDSKTKEMELIETPFPIHATVIVNLTEKWSNGLNMNNINRVVLRGTQEEIDKHPRMDGIKYIEEPTTEAKVSVINETDSPEVQFVKWAQEIKGYSDDLTSLGLEILDNV